MQITDVKSSAAMQSNQRWHRQAWNEMKRFYREDYLTRHQETKNRIAHGIGPVAGLATSGTLMAFGHWAFGLAAFPVVTYSILLASHPIFEGNKAATLTGWKNALKSIPCGFVMVGTDIKNLTLAGLRYAGFVSSKPPEAADKTKD